MLTVLFYHLVGSVTSQGQSLEQLMEVVSTLHVATQGGEIIVIGTTVEQTTDRVAVSREGIVWGTVLIVDRPEPLIHPSLSHVL